MVGDLIALMLDKTLLADIDRVEELHSVCAGHVLDPTRSKLKKFWKYDNHWKFDYLSRCSANKVMVSHDTEFALLTPDITVQIICSDYLLIEFFAQRFMDLHQRSVIAEVSNAIKSTGHFVADYTNDIIAWQEYHQFPTRFDIKNIKNKSLFLNDVCHQFPDINAGWASDIYTQWHSINC